MEAWAAAVEVVAMVVEEVALVGVAVKVVTTYSCYISSTGFQVKGTERLRGEF